MIIYSYYSLIIIFRLNSFPVYENEDVQDAIQSSYLYGNVSFGTGFSRTILGFPKLIIAKKEVDPEETMNNEFEVIPDKYDVSLQVCVLPGLEDLALFKESLTSSTFVIEVHKEDLHKRAFHYRNVEEYNTLLGAVKVDEPIVAVKGKAPPKAAPPTTSDNSTFGAITPGDSFLLQAIQKALTTSRQIRPHGTARFRLEQLLSSSNDLLTKFERRRVGIREGDDNIIVKV